MAILLRRAWYLLAAHVIVACGDASGPSAPLSFAQLDAGFAATCGVSTDGRGYCWGERWVVGRGAGTAEPVPFPQEIPGNRRWRAIEVGRDVACGLTVTNQTLCWSRAAFGFSGLDSIPTPLEGDLGFSQITVGDTHACGLTDSGVAYCWGDNTRGQRGLAYPDYLTAPRAVALPVAGTFRFLMLRGGPESTCGITIDGDLACWGGSEVEGDGFVPRIVQTGFNFNRFAFGGNIGGRGFVCAEDLALTLYCFGYESHASLPQPTPNPIALPNDLHAFDVAVGGAWLPFLGLPYAFDLHTCSVDLTRALWCWGSNAYGQLGDGTSTDRLSPTAVSQLTDVAAVTAGGIHTCVLRSNGMAYCWGGNTLGQLGIGSISDQESVPQTVRGPK